MSVAVLLASKSTKSSRFMAERNAQTQTQTHVNSPSDPTANSANLPVSMQESHLYRNLNQTQRITSLVFTSGSPKPEGHIITSARCGKASFLLTLSCSRSNWSRWYLGNSPSITYWEALRYLQKGTLPSHQRCLEAIYQLQNHRRGASPWEMGSSRLAGQTEGIDRTKWILLLGSLGGVGGCVCQLETVD